MTELAVSRQAIASAARALAHAGRWPDAAALLDAAPKEDPLLALTSAQVAVESDWFAGTSTATRRLAAAAALAAGLDDTGRWDLAFAQLRNAYRTLLMARRPDDRILRQAAELGATAPDEVRRGWAEMYQGLIADNLLDRPTEAPAHYTAALRAGTGDPLLAREALRHLGGHDHDAGNHGRALERWRRATELGAAGGNVPGTLSQQLLLARLARDTGNEPAAVALATEIVRWAGAIGATSLAAQATAFLHGADQAAPQKPAPAPFVTAPLAMTPRQ
jgi:tetratricopeptide (TPR) repeat protein